MTWRAIYPEHHLLVQVLFAMNMTVAYPRERDEIGDRATSLPLFSSVTVSAMENSYLGEMKMNAPAFDRDLGSLLVSPYWLVKLSH